MDKMSEQGREYQVLVSDQFEQYRLDSISQDELYSQLRTAQGDEYAGRHKAQGDDYTAAMQTYGDEQAAWQESRDKAIISAEALLGFLYDNFRQVFVGSVISRWLVMLLIQLGLLLLILVVQRRKDVV